MTTLKEKLIVLTTVLVLQALPSKLFGVQPFDYSQTWPAEAWKRVDRVNCDVYYQKVWNGITFFKWQFNEDCPWINIRAENMAIATVTSEQAS